MASRGGPTKRQKWSALLHTGGCSIAGLREVLRKLGHEDTPSKYLFEKANHDLLDSILHVEKLPTTDGGTYDWEFAEPNLCLNLVVSKSAELQEAFAQAARAYRCDFDNPWDIIISLDEFTTGDKLKPKNRRKTMVLAYNIKQLGIDVLCHDTSWIIPCLMQSCAMKTIRGGWSCMFKHILRLLTLGPLSITNAGVVLVLHGQPFHLYAKVRIVLTDLDGHRMTWDWRGAASIRACLKCDNCWIKGHHCLAGHVDIMCADADRFHAMEHSTLCNFADLITAMHGEMVAGRVTAARFQEVVKATGFNFNPDGVISDTDLREVFDFPSLVRIDWVHCELQGGWMDRFHIRR